MKWTTTVFASPSVAPLAKLHPVLLFNLKAKVKTPEVLELVRGYQRCGAEIELHVVSALSHASRKLLFQKTHLSRSGLSSVFVPG
jgi:hypothetical protein